MSDNLNCLSSLEVTFANMTGVGVRTLVLSLPRLRSLNFHGCPGISPDAIQWAKEKGLDVKSSRNPGS